MHKRIARLIDWIAAIWYAIRQFCITFRQLWADSAALERAGKQINEWEASPPAELIEIVAQFTQQVDNLLTPDDEPRRISTDAAQAKIDELVGWFLEDVNRACQPHRCRISSTGNVVRW